MRDTHKTQSIKVRIVRQAIYACNAHNTSDKEMIQTITRKFTKFMNTEYFMMSGKHMNLNAFPSEYDIVYTANGKAKYEILEIL